MAFLETGSLLLLLGCAGAKWVFTVQADFLAREVEQDRQTFRKAREALRMANQKRVSVRQELARTRKQVSLRLQDVELLRRQIEQEEALHQEELAEFEKLKEANTAPGTFASLESRAIFG